MSTLSSANVTAVNLVLKERTHMRLCLNMLIFTHNLGKCLNMLIFTHNLGNWLIMCAACRCLTEPIWTACWSTVRLASRKELHLSMEENVLTGQVTTNCCCCGSSSSSCC